MLLKEGIARKAQISMEYLIIVGFVTFIILGILAIALIYSGTIKDRIKLTQITDFANKVTSTADFIYYTGSPSKATVTSYFPKGIESIEITDNSLVFTFQTVTGLNKIGFSSKVPITGTITNNPGIKKIQILAQTSGVLISPA